MSEPDYKRPEYERSYPATAPGLPRNPGAVEHLAEAIHLLHDEISHLSNQLEPVLRMPSPEAALTKEGSPMTLIEECLSRVQDATGRLDQLRNRLVV